MTFLRAIVLQSFILLLLAGCSKSGEAVDDVRFTNLEINAVGVDALRLKLTADETVLTDSLISPAGTSVIPVEYYDPKHQIRLQDAYSDDLLLDTTIDYKPGFYNQVTFFQSVAGGRFSYIGPPVNESVPSADQIKLSVIYTHTGMPDTVKMVVENYNDNDRKYLPADSFQLVKNTFSKYFIGRNVQGRKLQLKFYTTDKSRTLKALVEEAQFFQTNTDFSIYLFRAHSAFTNGVYTLRAEKLY